MFNYLIHIIIFASIILSTLGQTPEVDSCPPNYPGPIDCSKYNVGLSIDEPICCTDNGGDTIQYANRCYAECRPNDGGGMYNCGKCCYDNIECGGGAGAGFCMLTTSPGGLTTTTAPPTLGYCYMSGSDPCTGYQNPCDGNQLCAYKGDGYTCVIESVLDYGNGGTPATTAMVECPNCECTDCGSGSFWKECSNVGDSCQLYDADPNNYDKCGTCFTGVINVCPPNSPYDCNIFPGTKSPVCCYSEINNVTPFSRYTDICIAECSEGNTYYCGPCCDALATNPCGQNSQTQCQFASTATGNTGVCLYDSYNECVAQLGYEAPCDFNDATSCGYRGVSGMRCVQVDFNGGSLSCGQCQPLPTTTKGADITTTDSGITSAATTDTATDSGTTNTATTNSGTTNSGTTNTATNTADSGTTHSGTTHSGTNTATNTATNSGTTHSGTTDSGTTNTATTNGGTTNSGTTDSGTTTVADITTTVSGTTDSGTTGAATDSRTTNSGTSGTGTTDNGTTGGTIATCTIWGNDPFEAIGGICDWCFTNRYTQKVCYGFVESVQATSGTLQPSWFDFIAWLNQDQIQCFMDHCNLVCDVGDVHVKEGVVLADSCNCSSFECCKSECEDGINECLNNEKCKEYGNGCNECVECLVSDDCPGGTCNNGSCNYGNASGATQISLMVGVLFLIGVIGWI